VTQSSRWLFGDQLGPHFTDGHHCTIIISREAFRRRRLHRGKAQLLLSAMLHRAAEENTELIIADTYRQGLEQSTCQVDSVIAPTSFAARRLVGDLGIAMQPSRGFVTSESDFAHWAKGRKRLRLEDFYRQVRTSTGVLMADDSTPLGGRWNFDHDNRKPPPKQPTLGLTTSWPTEDDLDEEARRLLTEWESEGWLTLRGEDGPRCFAVTRTEALAATQDFLTHRLAAFGPYEDAAMSEDWVMAHSLLSVPMNLGLLDPLEVVAAVESEYHAGNVPLASAEGFARQVIGWRDFIWHVYWWFGPHYVQSNYLHAHTPLPQWFDDLRADEVTARWTHHIVRLEILGNWALQQGYDPAAVNEWFTESFVDGFSWVMPANVIGMALYADGGQMSTKPYAAGGAYINKMTNLCKGCAYRPRDRVGERACPFTAGYWAFLHRNAEQLAGNHRLTYPYATMRSLADLPELLAAQAEREGAP
jgi:deoxyribodipyrimidine photolyase-related protein